MAELKVIDCRTNGEKEMDTYSIRVCCGNCGWHGKAKFAKGHPVWLMDAVCPECGCNKIRQGGYA